MKVKVLRYHFCSSFLSWFLHSLSLVINIKGVSIDNSKRSFHSFRSWHQREPSQRGPDQRFGATSRMFCSPTMTSTCSASSASRTTTARRRLSKWAVIWEPKAWGTTWGAPILNLGEILTRKKGMRRKQNRNHHWNLKPPRRLMPLSTKWAKSTFMVRGRQSMTGPFWTYWLAGKQCLVSILFLFFLIIEIFSFERSKILVLSSATQRSATRNGEKLKRSQCGAHIQDALLLWHFREKALISQIPDTRNTRRFRKHFGYGSGIGKKIGFGSGIRYPLGTAYNVYNIMCIMI